MASRPERAYRVASLKFPIFDGRGAFLRGGRWNSPGRRVIYASETFPGALLEVLAHTRIGKLPPSHAWIEIAIPAGVSIEFVADGKVRGWDKPESRAARRFGDRWFDEGRSLILVVPSLAASGLARNLAINQDHPEFGSLTATRPRPVRWDPRLFGGR